MGSDSDWPKIKAAKAALDEFGVPCEVRVMSAHRTPAAVQEYATTARERGLRVIIAAAGGAAHLAGVVAAHTTLPVIGLPVPTAELGGLDSLLSTVQMPGDVPVATMAVGHGGAAQRRFVRRPDPGPLPTPTLAAKFAEFKQWLGAENRRQGRPVAGDHSRTMPTSHWETLRWDGGHRRAAGADRPDAAADCRCRSASARPCDEVWEAIKRLQRARERRPSGSPRPTVWCWDCSRPVSRGPCRLCSSSWNRSSSYLESSRPTAVNLFWALRRMRDRAAPLRRHACRPPKFMHALLEEARAIHEEDRADVPRHWPARCDTAGRWHGRADALQRRLRWPPREYGTALAVIYAAQDAGQTAARLRRRNAPAAAGCAADRLGIDAARCRRHVDLRLAWPPK